MSEERGEAGMECYQAGLDADVAGSEESNCSGEVNGLYCVSHSVQYNRLVHDLKRSEAYQWNSWKGEVSWPKVNYDNLFKTSVFMDWDRRRSIHFNHRFINREELQAEEGEINEEDAISRHGELVMVNCEKRLDLSTVGNGSYCGISKGRRAGRYKYEYTLDKRMVIVEILKQQLDMMEGNGRNDRNVVCSTSSEVVNNAGNSRSSDIIDVAVDVDEDSSMVEVGNDVGRDRNDDAVQRTMVERSIRSTMRSNGIMRESSRKLKQKKKKRERVDESKFRLTDGNVTNRSGRVRLDDEEIWFKEACRIAHVMLGFMTERWIEVPHLRCVHLKENGRRMISVCSARVRRKERNGCVKETVTIGLMVEDLCKDVNTINVQLSRGLNSDGSMISSRERILCSCNVLRKSGQLVETNCAHRTILLSNDVFVQSIRERLSNVFAHEDDNVEDNLCFGSWIEVEGDQVMVGEEREDEIICTQVDRIDGLSLTKRGKSIARGWSCWNVYDVLDANFVCCIRKALGSGINVTKMKCTQCKFDSKRKCRHESACVNVIAEVGNVKLNENCEMQELGDVDDRNDDSSVHSGSEYSESPCASEGGDGGERSEVVELETENGGNRSAGLGNGGNGGPPEGRKCLYEAATFLCSERRRPLFMCNSEKKLTEQLTDYIELWDRRIGGLSFIDPDGCLCAGMVRNESGGERRCARPKESGARRLPRKVTLFTVNHGLLSVVLKDWICPQCGFENRYTGEYHAIYPAAMHRAFTVELVYFWMNECMNAGMSFRAMFELTNNLHLGSSYKRRIDTGRLDLLAPEFKRDRRLGNEALRKFCSNIDLRDDSECTKRLFSCKNCEVAVNDEDCKQLGLKAGQCRGLKRFSALVMDGKVIGALREFPVQDDVVHKLCGTKGLKCKLMSKRLPRASLKYFTQSVRKAVRSVQYGRGADVTDKLCRIGNTVYFKISALLDMKGVTKHNYGNYMKIALWFCENKGCLCTGKKWRTELLHNGCQKDRTQLSKKHGTSIASIVIGKLFGLATGPIEGEPVERLRIVADDGNGVINTELARGGTEVGEESMADPTGNEVESDDESDGNSDEDDVSVADDGPSTAAHGNSDIRAQWVYFKVEDSFMCTEVLELLLENIQFAIGEPITLGFYPYFTQTTRTSGNVVDNDLSADRSSELNRNSCIGDEAWDEWSKRYMETIGTGNEQSFLCDGRRRKKAIDMLSEESEERHRSVSKKLVEFSQCTHDGTNVSEFPCKLCCTNLDECYISLQEQNNIVASLLNEIGRVGWRAPLLSRTAADIVHQLLDAKLAGMEVYKADAAKKLDKSVSLYWSRYGHLNGKTVGRDEAGGPDIDGEKSRFVFPGRSLVRPPIKTDVRDKPECTKRYFTSRPNMTSFISLQCPCKHPKMIGFTLIKEVESISMAISTIIGFLNIPPRTIWYDNACNLYDSTVLRTPFLLRFCFLVVDRFHFQGHTCSNQYNPDRHDILLKQRSVAAEVLNSVLDKSAGFIRYLKGENIKPYLRVLFALHNFTAMMKDELNRKELPLLDMGSLYNERFACNCLLCQIGVEGNAWNHVTVHSVSSEPIREYDNTEQAVPVNGQSASESAM